MSCQICPDGFTHSAVAEVLFSTICLLSDNCVLSGPISLWRLAYKNDRRQAALT